MEIFLESLGSTAGVQTRHAFVYDRDGGVLQEINPILYFYLWHHDA
ncbi:hypothetical protein [Comamonas terrigena]|nr:hypothetical protein [Comamonas terrigena]MDH1701864.1 hypothetical protein [Comamonas terrigena]